MNNEAILLYTAIAGCTATVFGSVVYICRELNKKDAEELKHREAKAIQRLQAAKDASLKLDERERALAEKTAAMIERAKAAERECLIKREGAVNASSNSIKPKSEPLSQLVVSSSTSTVLRSVGHSVSSKSDDLQVDIESGMAALHETLNVIEQLQAQALEEAQAEIEKAKLEGQRMQMGR